MVLIVYLLLSWLSNILALLVADWIFSGVSIDGSVLRCRLDGPADALVKAAAAHTVVSITSEEPDLEDVFLELTAEVVPS